MDCQALVANEELWEECVLGEHLHVFVGGGSGEPSTIAAHALVNDEHARVGSGLGHNTAEELGTFLSRSPCTKGLLDGHHIIVNCLGQSNHGHVVAIALQELCQRS